MKLRYIKNTLLLFIACSYAVIFCMNYSSGPALSGQRKTGGPFDGGATCTGCHASGAFSPTTSVQLLSGSTPVTSYVPGQSYTVRITMTGTGITGATRYGFQIACVQTATNANADYWGTLPTGIHRTVAASRSYIEHSNRLTTNVINLPWTAPAASTGNMTFYCSGLINNSDGGTGGDGCNATSLTISPCSTIDLTISTTDVTCNGGSNGAIDLTPSSGSYLYSWTGPSGFTATTQDLSGLAAGTYSVTVFTTGGCTASTTTAITQPSAISATASNNAPFCPGDTLVLSGSASGGAGGYSYSWIGPAGFTSTLANPSLVGATAANNGTYTLAVTDANGCTRTTTTSVLLHALPVVNLGADGAICSGTPDTLDAANPGGTYLWSTGATSQRIVVADSGTYSVTVTNSNGCVNSDTIRIDISATIVPSVSISVSADTICSGNSVTFTASPVNGGSTPSYEWRKNGIIVGTSADTYVTTSIINNDRITCMMTSSSICALPATAQSDTIRMTVNTSTITGVTISNSTDTLCTGIPVTFTANPINGGTNPWLQWYRSGSPIDTGYLFTYTPAIGDVISVQMVSSLLCHTPDTARATAVYSIFPHATPSIHITALPADTVAYLGEWISMVADVSYGGSAPRYQWYADRQLVPGATNSTYNRRVYTNDTLVCVLTSNLMCGTPNKDTSNTVIIRIGKLGVEVVDLNTQLSIYPNPGTGTFEISGTIATTSNDDLMIEVRDMKGSVVYRTSILANGGVVKEKLSLPLNLPDGQYLVRLHSDTEDKLLRVVLKR